MSKVADNAEIDLDAAVQSLDPVVRRMAQRRVEINNEKAEIDDFLNTYYRYQTGGLPEKVKASPKSVAVPSAKTVRGSRGAAGGLFTKGRSDELMDAVREVLNGQGEPMRLSGLCDKIAVRFPEAAGQQVRLRAAIEARPDRVSRIGRKYWLPDAVGISLESNDESEEEPSEDGEEEPSEDGEEEFSDEQDFEEAAE